MVSNHFWSFEILKHIGLCVIHFLIFLLCKFQGCTLVCVDLCVLGLDFYLLQMSLF
jgi:hypothetical protein